jgi:hypothetical protein
MDDVSCSWQGQTIDALSFLAPAEEWRVDADGDVCLPEDGENPGFLIWLDGQRMRLSWGCIDFECDLQRDDYALTARWLMDAAAAWGATDE